MGLLRAHEVVGSVHEINFARLLGAGKSALIFDLDETLCKRATTHLGEELVQFLARLQSKGFKLGVLTNRRRNASDPIIHSLREFMPVVTAAGKPFHAGYREMLGLLSARPEQAVMIGDRIVTDILGANLMDIHSIRVSKKKRK